MSEQTTSHDQPAAYIRVGGVDLIITITPHFKVISPQERLNIRDAMQKGAAAQGQIGTVTCVWRKDNGLLDFTGPESLYSWFLHVDLDKDILPKVGAGFLWKDIGSSKPDRPEKLTD
jgi:hypothetical protein